MFPGGGRVHRITRSREGLGASGLGRCCSLSQGIWRQAACTLARVGGQPAECGQSGPGLCLASTQVSSRELVCRSCLKTTLHKLEGMMRILQAETTEGTVTPTTIADSILNITGVGKGLPSPSLQQSAPGSPTSCAHLQVTSSTWPAQRHRASSPQSWGLSRPH